MYWPRPIRCEGGAVGPLGCVVLVRGPMSAVRALVIGAGNAGLFAALALRKAGIEPLVYDAYGQPADRAIGGYLTYAVNGIVALRTIDAAHLVHRTGFACDT